MSRTLSIITTTTIIKYIYTYIKYLQRVYSIAVVVVGAEQHTILYDFVGRCRWTVFAAVRVIVRHCRRRANVLRSRSRSAAALLAVRKNNTSGGDRPTSLLCIYIYIFFLIRVGWCFIPNLNAYAFARSIAHSMCTHHRLRVALLYMIL